MKPIWGCGNYHLQYKRSDRAQSLLLLTVGYKSLLNRGGVPSTRCLIPGGKFPLMTPHMTHGPLLSCTTHTTKDGSRTSHR
ncbi:hypothetical protein GDO78_021140 [Eleutherodactylus coqui]|uniref:Uncharacterized protein n=1 Tax=Eleutherodactylus coqui TaxID=57060 RepID=A0A8J6E2U7_ELECQ|nr:hypothetical protein GDO78_021140 [Eleutherodactylus coqui]